VSILEVIKVSETRLDLVDK